MKGTELPEALRRDLLYGVRMLRKTPGFTAVALVTLAVAIGVNSAIFSVVNALLLTPLPYPGADRLATLQTTARSARGGGSRDGSLDGATFLALRDNATTIDVAAQGAGGWGGGVNLIAQNHAANVVQARVSAGYFKVLGVAPMVGREFGPGEDRAGGPPVAILTYDLWARLFQRDPDIAGRSIMLKGEPYTVVGVMPQGFGAGAPTDVWTPLRPSRTGEGGGTNYGLIARLRPGVTWDEANAEVSRIASPVMLQQYRKDSTVVCSLIPLQQGETSGLREPLMMLWGAVGLVLLIACVNIAGLLLARAGMRTREVATRMALGSTRGDIVRQLLVESAVLAVAGGALGVGVGWMVLAGLERLSDNVFTFGRPISLDARVLGATLVAALATSLLFGLVPALHASRVDVQATLAEAGTRSVAGGRGRWLRRILVAGEVAMGVVLLVSAGLLVRTFVQLRSLSPGFDSTNVVTATISLQDARYADPAKVARLFDETLSRIRQYPGVEAAGITLGLPYTRLLNLGFRQLDSDDPQRNYIVNLSYITPGYFEALHIPVRAGRIVTNEDRATSPSVAIVNEEFARRSYKDGNALGHRIAVAGGPREIVGIVGNARATSSGFQNYADPLVTPPIVYIPATQTSAGLLKLVHTWFSPSWVVRGSGSVTGLERAVRDSIAAVDAMLPISRFQRMTDVQAASLASQRLMMSLVLGLGAVALLLAAIGIHGLIASSVAERKRELGIRLALGATAGQVMRNVVMPAVVLALGGVAVGSGIALAAVRLLQSFLWGVKPADPLTFAAVVVTLLVVAILASLVPALRVLRLDPAQTLRAE
jgi:predicted permease